MNRELIYMHGPDSAYTDNTSLPKQIAPKRFFNYNSLTQAEMQLQLLDDKLEILESYYGDPYGDIQIGRNLIYQALTQGLQSFNTSIYRIPKSMYNVAKQIRLARTLKNNPASNIYIPSSIAGPNDIIPIEDCNALLDDFQDLFYEDNYGNFIDTPESNAQYAKYQNCKEKMEWAKILNDKWAESSPHLLYEYVSNPNIVPQTVTTKSILHKQALDIIHRITDLNRLNLRSWLNNGIMRANVIEGNSPYNAVESIQLLKVGGNNPSQLSSAPRIGAIDPVTVAAILKIIGALVAAVGATAGLINSIKTQNAQRALLLNNTQGYGTTNFSGTHDDWLLSGGNNDAPDPDNAGTSEEDVLNSMNPMALAAIVAGGFLLLKNQN